MKITKAEIFLNEYGKVKGRYVVGVRIHTDEGIYGDGEVAGIHATWSAYGMIRDLASRIIGMDPFANEVIWERLRMRTFWGQNGGAFWYSGVSAIDIALWDIKSKALNLPLYQLLGGKKRDKVRCYASQLQFGWGPEVEPATSIEDFVKVSKKAVSQGYDAIKIDFFTLDEKGNALTEMERNGLLPPRYVNMVRDRVAAVREAVGPDVDIIMENHSSTDTQAAIQLSQAVEPYNIYYFEEPNTPNAINTNTIKKNINMPISQGERLFGRWEYLPFFIDGSVQVIQPDLGNCGGITETKKLCDMAQVFDIGVQVHTCASHLLTPPSVILECTIPNFVIHEQHVNTLFPDLRRMTKKQYDPVNGYLDIIEEPGIGNEWSDEALATENKVIIE